MLLVLAAERNVRRVMSVTLSVSSRLRILAPRRVRIGENARSDGTISVPGATGSLGDRTARGLLESGHRVGVLTR